MPRTVDKYYKLNKNPCELINCQEKLKGETTIDMQSTAKKRCFNLNPFELLAEKLRQSANDDGLVDFNALTRILNVQEVTEKSKLHF